MNDRTANSMKNEYKVKLRFIVLTLFLVVFYTSLLFSATVYIDPGYSGTTQNGNIQTPYSSWAQVSFANGNTYLQKRGTTYTTSGKIFVYQKSNITIGAYGSGARPIIISSGGSGTKVVDIGFSQNCTVSDLEIASTGNATTCILIAGASSYNNTIDNCILRNCQWGFRATSGFDKIKLTNTEIHTISDDGVFIQDVTNVEISNCNIHDVNMNWYYVGHSQSQAAGDGIQLLGNCNNFIIHNNIINRSNSGNKFNIIVNSDTPNNATGVITHNIVTTPLSEGDGGAGIYLGAGNNILVEHNTIQGELDGIYNHTPGLKILGNVFQNLPVGVNSLNSTSTIYIANNTFHNVRTQIKGANIHVVNNIFNLTQTGDVAIYKYYPYILTENTNCYSSGQPGNNSIVGNPMFINASAGNFRLQSTSPCINHGSATPMQYDMDNISLPQGNAPDMGAFEYSGGQTSNNPPVINNQTFSINENSQSGTAVGTVTASDPDAGQTLAFTLISGNTNNAFTLNTVNGQLSVANSAALNFESISSFSLTIRVTDNGAGNLSSQATVTVSLNNVNETPVIQNQSFSVIQNTTNGTIVGTIIASDPDLNQTISFAIMAGNTNNAFSVNASNGKLSVSNSAALNPGTFSLTVRATDSGTPALYAQANVTVTVTQQGNQSPVIANQTFGVQGYAPNGTVVGTVVATDPDAGQSLSYSIISGNTSNVFLLNASTGRLTVANSGALTPGNFYLTVRATDNGSPALYAQATITIVVSQQGNQAPLIDNQTFTATAYASNGTVIGNIAAKDPDENQTLTFSIISGNTNNTFSLNSTSGKLTVANSGYMSPGNFNLTVRVTDNGIPALFSQAIVTITVEPTGNQPPVIANQTFNTTANLPNGTFIGTVLASDPDNGQTLRYSITAGNNSNIFALNTTNGKMTVANSGALNPGSYNITVRVTDNGNPALYAQATITIIVSSQSNQPPVITNQSFITAENKSNGSFIGTVLASDPNQGQTLSYSIVAGNISNAFAINTSNGRLSVNNSTALNFEVTQSFGLIVRVTDNGSGNLWSQATVTIKLTDVNEAPEIANQSFTIPENLFNGARVGYVNATDPDAGQSVTFKIISGNTNNAFELAAYTGSLGVKNSAALDFETNPVFNLRVRATDNSSQHLYSDATITVNLTNVNESPFISPGSISIAEFTPVNTEIYRIEPINLNQNLTYSIIEGNTADAFNINTSTGVVSVNNSAALNISENPEFTLIISVTDHENDEYSGTVNLKIAVISDENTGSGVTMAIENIQPENLKIFPNPSPDGIFHIDAEQLTDSYSLQVFDISGKMISLMKFQTATSNTIDLSGQPKGTYFLKISSPNSSFTHKVIKN